MAVLKGNKRGNSRESQDTFSTDFNITGCAVLCSVMSDSLRPHGWYSPWNSPGQNTGVGSFSLLQGIFPSQGSNPVLPYCRQILYQLSHKGSPTLQVAAAAKSLQLCPTPCDPIDSSPPGSSVPGILQARILEWVAISFSNIESERKWSRSVVSNSLRPHGL